MVFVPPAMFDQYDCSVNRVLLFIVPAVPKHYLCMKIKFCFSVDVPLNLLNL